MSASAPNADIAQCRAHVSFVPILLKNALVETVKAY
jgi:hypothetical protein